MSNNVTQDFDKTAFGELATSELTPVSQFSAQYGVLSTLFTVTDTELSGTTSVMDEMFTCETGLTSDGFASILSKRSLNYKPGQGILARLTAIFSPAVSGSTQAAGLLTAENSYTFGCFDGEFGIAHSFGGRDELQELTLTAGASGSESASVTIDGTVYIIPITAASAEVNAFEIAIYLKAQVMGYDFSSNANQVVAQSVLPFPQAAFAYSSATSSGAWVQLVSGSENTVAFTPQADWNIDTRLNGDAQAILNPEKGNVYQIRYKYLGFGAVSFYVEDSLSGDLVLVHRISYANLNTSTNVTNPSFRVGWIARNQGNTSNVKIQGASVGMFIEGKSVRHGLVKSDSVDQIGIGSTLTNLISLRNRLTFGNKVNRADIYPTLATGSTQSNKFAFFKIILNPVFADPVIFEYASKNNSIAETTKDAVGITGGAEVGTIVVSAGSSQQVRFNMSDEITVLLPGDTLCLAAVVPSGAAADCQTSFIWQEDL